MQPYIRALNMQLRQLENEKIQLQKEAEETKRRIKCVDEVISWGLTSGSG